MATDNTQPLSPRPNQASPSARKPRIFGRLLLILVGIVLAAFIAIQFIPVSHANPPVLSQIKWDSPQTQSLFQRACADCHSNQTVWPWYSYVAPMSWVVSFDVARGRRSWNLSYYGVSPSQIQGAQASQPQTGLAALVGGLLAGQGEGRSFGEGGEGRPNGQFPRGSFGGEGGFGGGEAGRISEQMQSGRMPPANYILTHPAANLTAAESQQLIQGLAATLQQSVPSTNPMPTPTAP